MGLAPLFILNPDVVGIACANASYAEKEARKECSEKCVVLQTTSYKWEARMEQMSTCSGGSNYFNGYPA